MILSPMLIPLLLIILIATTWFWVNVLVNVPVAIGHLLGSFGWSISGIVLLAAFVYFFGDA